MQISVESGEGLERRMRVDLAPEVVEQEIEKRLRDFARTARLPGFRPGKVPIKILRRRFGRQFYREVVGEFVESSFQEALEKEGLRAAGVPQIEPHIEPETKTYGYTATFEILPHFTLGSLEGKVLKEPEVEISESDVDALIERLREQNKRFEPVERPAQDGDQVTLSFSGTMEGKPFEGGSGEGVSLVLGSGRMIPGFESGLLGMQAGEERTLDLQFPEDYQAEHLRGKPVQFRVTLQSVAQPVLPEVDGEFAKQYGIEDGDLDHFRQDVRENMERELRQRIEARIKKQAMDLLLEANPIELPKVLVEQEIQSLKQQMQQQMGKQSPSFQLPDQLFEGEAKRRVALGLIVAEVIRANGIEVDEARVKTTVEDLAASYENPQAVVDYYYKNREQMDSVRSLTLENQVVDWVKTQVTLEAEPSTFEAITRGSSS